MHAEVRARGDRIVGAVQRAEQAHRCQDQRANGNAEHDGPHPRLERQPEQHRETAEHGGGECVGAAEDQAEQVQRGGVALIVGDLLDAIGLDTGRVAHGDAPAR